MGRIKNPYSLAGFYSIFSGKANSENSQIKKPKSNNENKKPVK